MAISRPHKQTPPALWLAIGFCIVLSAPLLFIFASWFFTSQGGLGYLHQHGLLTRYGLNSIIITLGTAVLATLIGVSTAFCVTCTNMPARKTMRWLVMMPFAVPSYVAAIIYADLFDSAGAVQILIRDFFALHSADGFASIRSIEGSIFILAITLYPYIYLLASAGFASQPRHMLETGQLLGHSHRALFFKIMLPMARPMIMVGVTLVMMETLADFGVVSLFGVSTYTTGIYRSWQGLYDPIAAGQMASLLLVLVLCVLWLERRARRQARYANPNAVNAPILIFTLSRRAKYLALAACALPVILGFGIPLGILIYWSSITHAAFWDNYVLAALGNSLTLGLLTAFAVMGMSLLLAMILRFYPTAPLKWAARLATSGYAMPGSVVAVGILLLLIMAQNYLLSGTVLLTGTLAAMVWACGFRFLTIGFNTTEAGLTRITPLIDDCAKTLGRGAMGMTRTIHLPLIWRGLAAGFVLVFVDTVKELPASILLRPFNFDTLAIRTFELAGDELLQRAGPSALLLVLFSMLAIALLVKQPLTLQTNSRENNA